MQGSAPGSPLPAIPETTYGASPAGLPFAPPVSTVLPKITPGRSLDGVTITPAPEHDRFGTLPLTTHKQSGSDLMLRAVPAVSVACTVLAGVLPASAQSPPTQLDRIEQKLDTILHRLDQLQPGQAAAQSPPPGPGSAAAPAATPALSSAPETLADGAVAIIHAAPTKC
jgi:hypothetical protein